MLASSATGPGGAGKLENSPEVLPIAGPGSQGHRFAGSTLLLTLSRWSARRGRPQGQIEGPARPCRRMSTRSGSTSRWPGRPWSEAAAGRASSPRPRRGTSPARVGGSWQECRRPQAPRLGSSVRHPRHRLCYSEAVRRQHAARASPACWALGFVAAPYHRSCERCRRASGQAEASGSPGQVTRRKPHVRKGRKSERRQGAASAAPNPVAHRRERSGETPGVPERL